MTWATILDFLKGLLKHIYLEFEPNFCAGLAQVRAKKYF